MHVKRSSPSGRALRERSQECSKMSITLAQEVKLLAAVDCLETLSEEELEKFAKRHLDAYYEPGEIISTPWEKNGRLLILKKGRV